MTMRRDVLILLIVAIALLQVPAQEKNRLRSVQSYSVSNDEPSISRHWTVNIIFVNYDSNHLATDSLLHNLPNERIHQIDDLTIRYTVEYALCFANDSYSNQILSVIENNRANGTDTGTRIDETKLEYQKEHPHEPQRIFYPRSGMSIDAYVLEDWLAENPYVESPPLGYNFYLFNYSQLDSHDHAVEHWYDYHPVDPDTGQGIDWFRLEWDNELNPEVNFQYTGFGGRKSLYVLDPSANQWYFRWARIWWGEAPYDDAPEYCTKDLEDKVAEVDLSTQEGIESLSEYLGGYMMDVIGYVHFPKQHQPAKYVDYGTLKAMVFSLEADSGVLVESIKWVTNAAMQRSHLEELLPFVNWEVNVSFHDIEDTPEWNDTFWEHAESTDGETVVDGLGMFNDIYENLRYKYVDVFSEQINVFGVVFIKKNMTMYAFGRQYTGLGGGGQTAIWKTWERYYCPDGVTPREGVSGVQLHETMHAIGFGHTWVNNHYAGDSSYSPMGYFGIHNGTSVFDQNWVQSTYLDQMEWDHWNRFLNISDLIPEDPRFQTTQAREETIAAFTEARRLYDSMNWSGCFDALEKADAWTTRLMYSIYDTEAPEFVDWGIESVEDSAEAKRIWAIVRDDLSGIDSVSVRVIVDTFTSYQYQCHRNNGQWIAYIPALNFDRELAIWLEAVDLGLNTARTEVVRYTGDSPNLFEYMIAYPYFLVGGIVVLVLVAILYHRTVEWFYDFRCSSRDCNFR